MSAAEKKKAAAPERLTGKIRARIIDAENGLRMLSRVSAVRVKSKGYNLLIMDDYMPALGRIDGSITFLTAEEELRMENIRGFYKHQHNEFTLLIEEHGGEAPA